MEAIRASLTIGVSIPDDLKIIGFDDINFASTYSPSITTVAQPKYEMGTTALELVQLIEKKDLPKRKVLVEPKLILRDSRL